MRIEIDIPKEFEEHFKQYKFKDSFERIMADIWHYLEIGNCLCSGNYEYETIKMLEEALENSKTAYDVDYEEAEEQGLLLRLPCKVGEKVYCIYERYTKCSEYGQVFEEYSCQGCECLECDSHKELYVQSQKAYSLDWIVSNLKRFGKTVFLTQAEAEQKLKEMESK